jgi:hypothetical protein
MAEVPGVEGFWLDVDGCVWRSHPEVPDQYQIFVESTKSWSDCDVFDEDAPFTELADFDQRPCTLTYRWQGI